MREYFSYEFDNITRILYKYYFGMITVEDIIHSWQYAFQNQLIPVNVKGFILDYRGAHFDIEIDENRTIATFYKKNTSIFGNFKFAIITVDPKDITVPVLVAFEDDGYYSKPFSTVEAALSWILE